MLMYCKIANEAAKSCDVGLGTDAEYYSSLGMTQQEVELGSDGVYYLAGYAPAATPQELVDMEAFIAALYGLIPAETLQTTLLGSADALKEGVAGLALLTTNAVQDGKLNLLDPRVDPLLTTFGLTLDAVRSALNTTTE